MRHILLFRHAEAVPSPGYRDHERPLSPAGRACATRMGGALAVREDGIDLILVSDSRRTLETLDLALAAYGQKPEVRLDPQIYAAQRRDLLVLLAALPEDAQTVMIVGHNPAIAELALILAGDGASNAFALLMRGFPPGGLAFLSYPGAWDDLRAGACRLDAFLT